MAELLEKESKRYKNGEKVAVVELAEMAMQGGDGNS